MYGLYLQTLTECSNSVVAGLVDRMDFHYREYARSRVQDHIKSIEVIFQESTTPEANRVNLKHTIHLGVVRYRRTEPKYVVYQVLKCLEMSKIKIKKSEMAAPTGWNSIY